MKTRVRRAVERAVEKYWSDYSIEVTGSDHVRVRLRRKGRSRFVIVAQTPSDMRRFEQNFERDIRKTIRELKEATA